MSLLYTGVYWPYQVEAAAQRGEEISFWWSYLRALPGGNASIHFWYIPLLMFLFVITPLLKKLHQISGWTLTILALLPLVVSRSPFPDFLMPQSFVYFTGAYALGIVIGDKYQEITTFVARYWLWLLIIVFALTGGLYWQYAIEYQPEGWYSSRQTLVYLQKVGISLVLIYFLQKIATQIPKWLMILGDYAFAIFFLHVVFIGFFIQALFNVLQSERNGWLFLSLGLVNLIVCVAACVAVSMLLKKLLKSHSRKIIGA